MKFVHIADLHLDMPFISLRGNKDLIKRRKLEQKFAFKKVIDYILENKVELLLISGDLFEQKYVTDDTINYLISNFKSIPDTKIYITPGNHDPLIKKSPYNTFEWPDNVFIFGGEVGLDTYKNVDIYGQSFIDYYMEENEIDSIKIDDTKVNILITHGTLNGAGHKYNDIKEKQLLIFDYVALGHIHMPKVDSSNIIYPGSLTSCGFDEPGEHGMVVGEIEDKVEIINEKATRLNSGLVKYKFIKLDDTEFVKLKIDITDITSVQELIDKLEIDEKNIYEIELFGERSINISKIIEQINSTYKNVCDVTDSTHIKYNLEEIAKEETLKGIFTKKILEEIEKNPNDKDEILQALEFVYESMKG